MNTKTKLTKIGNVTCILTSDYECGELLDTRVLIESGTLCYIAGSEIDKFLKEINDVIQKYRI